MRNFKEYKEELINEAKSAKDLVKMLNKYDATIININNPSEADVIEWADASIMYASEDGYADAFDMSTSKFKKFANDIKDNAKEVASLLK